MLEITPELLLQAYRIGVFPMGERRDDPKLYWLDPRLRAILPLDAFHLPKRLARTYRFAKVVFGDDGSVTPYALSAGGAPLLLLSRLAAHTRNLTADPRAGLFVGDRTAAADPQAGARVSLLGQVRPLPGADVADGRTRYLDRWPKAADYFALDFSLWRFDIEEARLIAGFGEIRWLTL